MTATDEFAIVPESARSAADFIVTTAQSLADALRSTDIEVQALMSSWRGTAADAYAAGWREVHRGADEIFTALRERAEAIGVSAAALAAVDVQRARAQASATATASSLDLP
ncbi:MULTISPECIES: WXG100 family type VII secretion target [unclassified Nocardia]|uniref:WXG100 family type VII secretion target n=1 Tax=unclassified Nocardia TaxID=2637762 RepID=UPI001CE45D6D|nr:MULTISPECIES: WXG100 family type VII secretion target [unclassified Nocardia]